jgi:hypothetical protein
VALLSLAVAVDVNGWGGNLEGIVGHGFRGLVTHAVLDLLGVEWVYLSSNVEYQAFHYTLCR